MIPSDNQYLTAEVVMRPENKNFSILEGDESIFPQTVKNYMPQADSLGRVAKRLMDMRFRVLEIGVSSITVAAIPDLFEKHKIHLEQKKMNLLGHKEGDELSFFASPQGMKIQNAPEGLGELVEGIVIPEPPVFFTSPFPPDPSPPYLNLHPAGDVPMIMRASELHAIHYTGKGVKLAMIDTGFYPNHPYYSSRHYKLYTTGLPLPGVNPDTDEVGHGTAIASSALAVAPGVSFVSVKMGGFNPAAAFKLAVRQRPNIITNSWGYDIDSGTTSLDPSLVPLELEIASAVRNGITVLFAAGNGHHSWPGSMPEVISVGGGYVEKNFYDDLEASDYASSFDSSLYAGRHVPDVCGLVGKAPGGIYIMSPTQPNCAIDRSLAGGSFPNKDQTMPDDGWACLSGTSSATPMVAGVVALLMEKKPDILPDEVKAILEGTARDITKGRSSMGDKADVGWDRATGYGLVDAYEAWRAIP